MSKKKFALVAALVLVTAVIALAAATARKGRPSVGPFTLEKTVTIYKADGTQEVRREIYRRTSDGSFRIVETDGKVIYFDRGFSQGRGFFHVDYGTKTLWRDTTQKPDRGPIPVVGPDVYTKNELYAGTEVVMGRTAYILRVPNKAGSVDTEEWFLPELGVVAVRGRYYKADGSLARTEEPYELDFSEPDPTLVKLPEFAAADDVRGSK